MTVIHTNFDHNFGHIFAVISVPKAPVDVEITAINGKGAYNITWDIEETPGLGYFKIWCEIKTVLRECGQVPAHVRSFDLVIEDPASVYILKVFVEAYGASDNTGGLSRAVEITVSQSKLFIGFQCEMYH